MSLRARFSSRDTSWPVGDARMEPAQQRFHARLHHLPDESARIGEKLISKLSPPRWTLEWYLPQWLAATFGLDEAVADDLVLANLFGLCFIGLQDHLTDDEVTPNFRHDALLLGTALHHWWLEQNALICRDDPLFWENFSRIMQEWWRATAVSNVQPIGDFNSVLHNSWQLLAHRASPLKVCCVAVTRRSKCTELLVPLEESLDHLHIAAVLLDHAQDWMDDLSAGRYNAFVHHISPGNQSPENRAKHERRVMETLWFGEGNDAYFSCAHENLDLAMAAADAVGCTPYSEYISNYHMRLDNYSRVMLESARKILEQATTQIFGKSH
jgi:hypothetical protein